MKQELMKRELSLRFDEAQLAQIVWMHTHRTTLMEELNPREIYEIYQIFFNDSETRMRNLEHKQRIKELRSIVLKDAQYLGLYTPNSWERFNRFMLKRSPLKKRLVDYKEEEFEGLIKQLKSMKTKFDKKARIPGTKEWNQKNEFPIPGVN